MQTRQVKLVTLNLWWHEHYRTERLREVRAILDRLNPDFVTFQEVSSHIPETFQELFRDYRCWPSFEHHAGNVILTRSSWTEIGRLKLTSGMGRELVWFRTEDLVVATVHLESLKGNRQFRVDQLYEVFEHLERFGRVVLMGDFNFAPDWVENAHLHTDYVDVWSLLHPEEPGYTEDTDINLMRLNHSGKEKHVRFDRILVKGDLNPLKIDLIGTEPLSGLPEVWPSDHFGLACDLEPGARPPENSERLLMLGRDYQAYGQFDTGQLGRAIATISVGADPESPSMAAKGRKAKPNEDGLLVLKEGPRYLLAVADGHFGNETSHALLGRLGAKPFPATLEVLAETVHAIQQPSLAVGAGSSFTAAVYDESNGKGFGVSTGDSTLATIIDESFLQHTEPNSRFVYFNKPVWAQEWHQFRFQLPPGELLILYTDGINECHYRNPETSVTPDYIRTLWQETGKNPELFSKLLVQLALQGVGGNPGGQDNIALIVLA